MDLGERKVLELKQEFGLNLLNEKELEYRPEQWNLIREILGSDQHLNITAETGSGKTILFILKALQVIGRGHRVFFTTVRKHLVNTQFKKLVLRLSYLNPDDILTLSGDISPVIRAELYRQKKPCLISTREVFDNDSHSNGIFVWEGMRLACFDEIHHGQGKDTYVRSVNTVKKQPAVQRMSFSATPAADARRLYKLFHLLDFDRHLIMHKREDIFQYREIYVDLNDEFSRSGDLIKYYILHCQGLIEKQLEGHEQNLQLNLFNLDDEDSRDDLEDDSKVPDYGQRELLKLRIERSEHEEGEKNRLYSLWAELGLLCWFYDSLTTCGRYAFLQDYAYRHSKLKMYPRGIYLPEYERNKSTDERRFEKRAIDKLWVIFCRLAMNTPFQPFISYIGWEEVLEKYDLKVQSSQLKDWQNVTRQFHRLARKELARSPKNDHPKISELMNIFEIHPPHLSGQGFVFTGTRRHAAFLAKLVKHRFRHLERSVVHAYSPFNSAQAKLFENNLQLVRTGQASVFITTDYSREAVDVSRAQFCIEYMMTDTNPIKKAQGRGRVGRDKNHKQAYIYYLITRQTGEYYRFIKGLNRSRNMNRIIRTRGELILPDVTEEFLLNEGGIDEIQKN